MPQSEESEVPATFCYADLSRRCLDNAELVQRVLSAFINGVASDLEQLERAIDDQDRERAGKTAHRIKGSASNAAAYQISFFAGQIETGAKENPTQPLLPLVNQLHACVETFLDTVRAHREPATDPLVLSHCTESPGGNSP